VGSAALVLALGIGLVIVAAFVAPDGPTPVLVLLVGR
jgi:hypothetical protein